jgi:hypothetical protein
MKAVVTRRTHCAGVKKHSTLSISHVTLSHRRIVSYYRTLL